MKDQGDFTFLSGQLSLGQCKILVTEPESGHQSVALFLVWNKEGSGTRTHPHIARIETDKTVYAPGEQIHLKIPDIHEGKALISAESGHKMMEQMWYDISKNNRTLPFKAADNWPAHIYIHVTILQPYKQDHNDLPLRNYGIVSA